jgi:hypothetical protein
MKSTKIMYWVSTGIICLFASTAIMMNSKMAIAFFGLLILILSYSSFHKLQAAKAKV